MINVYELILECGKCGFTKEETIKYFKDQFNKVLSFEDNTLIKID